MSKQLALINNAITQLKARGLDYGAFFPIAVLRELAGPDSQDDVRFGFFKMALVAELREMGFCLSESGMNGQGMRVMQAVEHFHVATRWQGDAQAALERGVTLLTHTDQTRLTPAEQTRDANALRELQHQKMMLSRTDEVIPVLKRHKPGLLKADIEAELPAES